VTSRRPLCAYFSYELITPTALLSSPSQVTAERGAEVTAIEWRRHELRRGVAALAVCLVIANSAGAGAAEIVRSTSPVCDARLEGEIKPGDFERLKDKLTEKMRLCLHSPGGSYFDGIDLFEQISERRIGTVVDKEGECYSACAIAFMGGADGKYGDRFPDRKIIAGGVVGFHSPYSSPSSTTHLPPELNSFPFGVRVGIISIARVLRADKHSLLPRSLIAVMLETSPSSVFKLDTYERIRAANVALVGFAAPAKITKRMLYQACANSDPWMAGKAPSATAAEAKESELAVVDQPPRYRIVFGGFGFRAMDSCAVEIVDRPVGRQMFVKLDYGELRSQPMRPQEERPLWYLLPLGQPVLSSGE
jgi:hypothetical protein